MAGIDFKMSEQKIKISARSEMKRELQNADNC